MTRGCNCNAAALPLCANVVLTECNRQSFKPFLEVVFASTSMQFMCLWYSDNSCCWTND